MSYATSGMSFFFSGYNGYNWKYYSYYLFREWSYLSDHFNPLAQWSPTTRPQTGTSLGVVWYRATEKG